MKYIALGALLFGIGMFSGLTLIIKISFHNCHIRKKQEKFLWSAFAVGMLGGLIGFMMANY